MRGLGWIAACFLSACSTDGEQAADSAAPVAHDAAAQGVPWSVRVADAYPLLAVDGDGQVVMAGSFADEVQLSGDPLQPQGYDLVIAGLDRNSGAVRFSASYGGPGDEHVSALEVDPASGDIALAGVYLGDATAGGEAFPPPPDTAAYYHSFFARYDPSGAHRWSFRCSSELNCNVSQSGGSLTPSGDLLATGYFAGTLVVDEVAYGAGMGQDIFFLRASAAGKVEAVRNVGGGTGTQLATAATIARAGGVYLLGAFDTSFTIDGQLFSTTAGQSQLFVGYLTAGGTGPAAWGVQGQGALLIGNPFGLATPDGDLVVVGIFQGDMQLGGRVLEAQGGWDAFLARISSGGAVEWAQAFGGSGSDFLRGAAMVGDQIWLLGDFQQTASFGGDPLESAGESDIVLARYAIADGAHILSRRFGGAGFDTGASIAVSDGVAFIGVQTTGTLDLGLDQPIVAEDGQVAGAVVRLP